MSTIFDLIAGIYVQFYAGSTVAIAAKAYGAGLGVAVTDTTSRMRISGSALWAREPVALRATALEDHAITIDPKGIIDVAIRVSRALTEARVGGGA